MQLKQQFSESISPYGPSVSGKLAGTTGSPIQYDENTYTINGVAGSVGGWYLSVDSTNAIYTTLSSNTQYNTVALLLLLHGNSDPRDLQDRTYRVRYVIDKDKTNPLPRDLSWFHATLNSDTTSYAHSEPSISTILKLYKNLREVLTMGYYLTLLCASITPSTSNFNDNSSLKTSVSTFDRDNPVADPLAAISVADNETIGLVNATDGANPTPAKDPKRSI